MRYNIVEVNNNMTTMTARNLIERLKKLPPDTPVFISTDGMVEPMRAESVCYHKVLATGEIPSVCISAVNFDALKECEGGTI